MAVHNAFEMPYLPFSDPQYLYPSLVSFLLLLAWLLHAQGRKVWGGLLFVSAVLHLVGGGLISVLPLPFLPFEPEQSLPHYFVHFFYGTTQLPLLWLLAHSTVNRDFEGGPQDK
jgi:hypothetical protein